MTNRHRSRRNSQKNLEDIKLVLKLFPNLNPIVGYENYLNNRSSSSNSVLGRKVVKEHGLECKIERYWLGIKCYGDKLLALSPEGNLFLYDRSSGLVLCLTPTGKPLHVSHGSSVSLAAIRELSKHAKGSELADLNFKASDLVGKSDVVIVPSKSETVLYVNQRTGHLSSATNSVNDEILCIKRFDFQITCYEENTNTVLGYRRITSIHVSEVNRSDPRFCEKNDALARMGQTLVKQGTVGKISRSNRVIGEGDKDTVLVEGEVQKRAVIACVKKGQSHDDDKRVVSNLIDICDANSNFVNVYAVEKDRDFIYVATERCDTSLRAFMKSFHNPENQHLKDRDKLLKLIWGIVTAIASLHYNGISHGNIDINNIFVDKYSRAKIQVIGKGFRGRDAFKDRFSLSKEATCKHFYPKDLFVPRYIFVMCLSK